MLQSYTSSFQNFCRSDFTSPWPFLAVFFINGAYFIVYIDLHAVLVFKEPKLYLCHLTTCVTLGIILSRSEPEFPYWQNGFNNDSSDQLTWFLWGSNDSLHIETVLKSKGKCTSVFYLWLSALTWESISRIHFYNFVNLVTNQKFMQDLLNIFMCVKSGPPSRANSNVTSAMKSFLLPQSSSYCLTW